MVLKNSKHNDNQLPTEKNALKVHLKSSDQKVHLVSAAAKIGKFSWPGEQSGVRAAASGGPEQGVPAQTGTRAAGEVDQGTEGGPQPGPEDSGLDEDLRDGTGCGGGGGTVHG